MPLSLWRKLSATRSALRMLATLPKIVATISPGLILVPSLKNTLTLSDGSTRRNTLLAISPPANIPFALTSMDAFPWSWGGISVSLVISPWLMSSARARSTMLLICSWESLGSIIYLTPFNLPCKYDVALPFRGAPGEISAEVGATAFLSEQSCLGYQSTGQHQVV
ncbi:hypothetical protein ES703_122901 [subsurface metagenome]